MKTESRLCTALCIIHTIKANIKYTCESIEIVSSASTPTIALTHTLMQANIPTVENPLPQFDDHRKLIAIQDQLLPAECVFLPWILYLYLMRCTMRKHTWPASSDGTDRVKRRENMREQKCLVIYRPFLNLSTANTTAHTTQGEWKINKTELNEIQFATCTLEYMRGGKNWLKKIMNWK